MMPRCYIVVLFFAYGYTLSLMAMIIDAKLLLMHHHHHLALIHHQPSLIPFRGRQPKQQRRIYNPQLSCCQGRDIKIAGASNIDDEPLSSVRQKQVLYVAKTIESFKLADVYWLESCVMAASATDNMPSSCMDNNDISVDRLAFHRPTASYLLGYYVGGIEEISSSINQLPFRTNRFQYVAKVITSGTSPQDLLKNIGGCCWSTDDDCNNNKPLSWILDYDTFEPIMQKKSFSSSSTMLMCAISRLLPGEPVLSTAASIDNDDATTTIAKYIIIETASLLYLVQKMLPHHNEVDDDHSSNAAQTATTSKRFKDIWSKRPFQYSGAINLDVAMVIIDTLHDILLKKSREDTTTTTTVLGDTKAIRILDPTCGSGTFLALPLIMWRNEMMNVEVVGIDSNEKCVEGTVRNLKHVYKEAGITINESEDDENDSCWNLTLDNNNTTLSSKATIYAKDSSVHMSSYISQKFDCAVANLPWNRNTFEYDEGSSSSDSTTSCINSGILNATAAALKPGAPLVVVSGRDNNDDHHEQKMTSFNTRISLEKLGLHVIGEATIPPMGFDLPVSTKKRDNASGLVPKKKEKKKKKKRVSRSSDCMITVAITPQR